MGKGSKRRRCTVSEEESDLRWVLAFDTTLTAKQYYDISKRIEKLEVKRVSGNSNDNTD